MDTFDDEAGALALAGRLAEALKVPPPERVPNLPPRPANGFAVAIVALALGHVLALAVLAPRLARQPEHLWWNAVGAAIVLGIVNVVSWLVIVRVGAHAERAHLRRELG